MHALTEHSHYNEGVSEEVLHAIQVDSDGMMQSVLRSLMEVPGLSLDWVVRQLQGNLLSTLSQTTKE